jgi:nitrite reductase/ring-hydroxylating ferredoxin subunit
MQQDALDAWWAVARSEEITAKQPFSVDIGDQPLVLWRDEAGVARALEDRCPHRRAPLSRGCVRDNGWIQCGYHGWSYDGATGKLVEIPNMKSEQRFPPLYKALSFAVQERGGFVRVSLNGGAVAQAAAANLPLGGTTHVALAQDQYVTAFFDDPGLLIGIRGVSFTPYLAAELHAESGRLVMERYCQWKSAHWPAPFSSEFPISLLSSTDPITGETEMTLRDAGLGELFAAVIAPVPAARGVTAIRWRAGRGTRLSGLYAALLGAPAPFRVFDTVDAGALRKLLPSVSLRAADLRATLIAAARTVAA